MLLDKINSDLKSAMREKDEFVLSVLRMLISAVRNKEISERKDGKSELSENDVIAVLKSELKKRLDSIKAYRDADREDLAVKEEKEIEIIEKYLPQGMSEEEIEKIVKKVVSEINDVSMKDFGKVMGTVIKEAGSGADGNMVADIVRKMLNK